MAEGGCGDAGVSHWQLLNLPAPGSQRKLHEEMKKAFKKEEQRHSEVLERLDRTSRVLELVKDCLEHLANKLSHVQMDDTILAGKKLDRESEDYPSNLLVVVQEKLLKLQEHLDNQDVPEMLRHIADREFLATLEGKLPLYNTRILLPVASVKDKFFDEEESEDDDRDVVTRAAFKIRSQKLIEARSKKRNKSRRS